MCSLFVLEGKGRKGNSLIAGKFQGLEALLHVAEDLLHGC
jgi:hypothetical protein